MKTLGHRATWTGCELQCFSPLLPIAMVFYEEKKPQVAKKNRHREIIEKVTWGIWVDQGDINAVRVAQV